MDSPWPQIFGGCFVLAAVFYGWLKFLNWRDAKRWGLMKSRADAGRWLDSFPRKEMREDYRAWWKKFRNKGLLLALMLPLAGCDTMTPAERAALTSFALDTATMARDKKFGPKAPKAGKMSGKAVAPTVPPKGTEKLFE